MKTVFKDEHKLKQEVETHLSEEKETCGCGCEIGKCDCGPECTKCDCGKKKDAKEDWDPTGSVGVSGVSQDVARKGMNTLWENEMGIGGLHQEPFFGAHPGHGWTGASGNNYGWIDFESEMPGDFETVEVESLEQAQQALGLSDREFRNLIGSRWYGANPENLFNRFKKNQGNLILKIRNKKEDVEKSERKLTLNDFERMVRSDMMNGAAMDEYVSDEKVKKMAKSYYNDYLQGADPEEMFYENKEPKWLNEIKNNFKRLIK